MESVAEGESSEYYSQEYYSEQNLSEEKERQSAFLTENISPNNPVSTPAHYTDNVFGRNNNNNASQPARSSHQAVPLPPEIEDFNTFANEYCDNLNFEDFSNNATGFEDREPPKKKYIISTGDSTAAPATGVAVYCPDMPKLSSELFIHSQIDSKESTVRERIVPTKSKHFSVPVPTYQTKVGGRKYRTKSRPFSDADYFYNSFFYAEEKLAKYKDHKLDPKIPLPRKINFRGRRRLKKLLHQAMFLQDEIYLHSSFFGNEDQNRDNSIIVDSGTTLHIGRDRSDFRKISTETVRIRGVAGNSIAYRGILKDSALGSNIQAIWFEKLPVKMLLSVLGLARDGWNTQFTDNLNYAQNRRTGEIIKLKTARGLPCLNVSFDGEVSDSYLSTQSVENSGSYDKARGINTDAEWDIECTYCDEPIPKQWDQALVDTKVNDTLKGAKTKNKKINRKRKRDDEEAEQAKHPGETQMFRSKVSKLLEHQRFCHMFTDPSTRCRCFDCLEFKGRKASHDSIRKKRYDGGIPFTLFSCDFFGQIKPESFRGCKWVLLYICDCCGYTKCHPLKNKSDAPYSLVKFVNEVRAKCGVHPGETKSSDGKLFFRGIHSDNEPVLRGELWRQAVRKTGLTELHSVPYCPQQNGTCERMVGTIKSALRTTMHNVDPRVWDYCVEHIGKVWNVKVSKKASKYSKKGVPACPDDIMEQESSNPFFRSGIHRLKYLKRFGCLTYFKKDVAPEGPDDLKNLKNFALRPRRVKGIHLGFSGKNSAWLVGTMNSDKKFTVYETIDAVFVESVLVRDIRLLCKSDTSLPVVDTNGNVLGLPSSIFDSAQPQGSVQTVEAGAQVVNRGIGSAQARHSAEEVIPTLGEILGLGGSEEEHSGDIIIDNSDKSDKTVEILSDGVDRHATDGAPMEKLELQGQTSRIVEEFDQQEPQVRKGKNKTVATKEALKEAGVVFGPPAPKKRRGRPPGSKDVSKRTRRSKKGIQAARLDAFWLEENTENNFVNTTPFPVEYAHLAMDADDEQDSTEISLFLAKDEPDKESDQESDDESNTPVEGSGFKPSQPGDSVKPTWAFKEGNPERPSWIMAKDKEGTRILAYKTWRKLSKKEEDEWRAGRLKAVPCALLLNRKRCGRFKARLVVLGNRWQPDTKNSVYASVVSQTGNRAVVTHCAREGFHIIPFDISNAFIRAEMGDLRVVIKLPDSFKTGPDDDGKRMLLKALYGLPISPRLWAKTLTKDLTTLGWEECKSEPGVYRKYNADHTEVVAYITVYVDDCIVGAKTKELCEAEVAKINAKHPLEYIKVQTDDDDTMHFDMCGADIAYNAKLNSLKISMSNYIDKILKRFNMEGCKARPIPGFEEEKLYTKSKPCDFKYKAAVGALQWLATTARPDIAHSTNMLARAGAQPVTKAMHKCVKLVFKYLEGTKDVGLEYSKQIEEEFDKEYAIIGQHEDNVSMNKEELKAPLHLFTDASFGVAYKTLRSITGVVVYLHGMPIAWKTKVQTIHTSSTTESEWVALADGIEFSQSCYGLQRFLVGKDELAPNEGPIWQDNRPVCINARKGPEGSEEIPKKTRHIALRYARVLEHGKRLWFVPTDHQLADGLTKSVHRNPLLQIFTRVPANPEPYTAEEEEEDLDFTDCYFSGRRKEVDEFDAWLVSLKVHQSTWYTDSAAQFW